MKNSKLALLLLSSAVAACSSSEGDGSEPDASSSSAAAGTTSASGGQDGEPDSDQNRTSLVAWQWFQGEFDTLDQAPVNEDGPIPPERQRMVGCAVVAPGLSERIVYVERSAIEGDSGPNRQMLIAFMERPGDEGKPLTFSPRAIGTYYQLADPEHWAGQCQPGVELSLLSEVISADECTLSLQLNEVGVLHVVGSLTAPCVATSLEVEQVGASMVVGPDTLTWRDDDGGGGNWQDPPPDPSSGESRSYVFERRTPWLEARP